MGGEKIRKAYDKRCNEIVSIILSLREDMLEPWVVNGRWSWNSIDGTAYAISLVLPERPLIVQVLGPEIGEWDKVRRYCLNRKSWEIANRIISNLKITCKKMNVPLVLVGWNEPISSESLSIKLKEAENG